MTAFKRGLGPGPSCRTGALEAEYATGKLSAHAGLDYGQRNEIVDGKIDHAAPNHSFHSCVSFSRRR